MPASVLVIGGGGREHAIVRQLARSPQNPVLYASPGNPGTAALARNIALDLDDPQSVVRFCQNEAIELVIIGPEDPLIAGLADHLHHGGIAVFGPGAMGARLEGDKEFAKEVLHAAGVPTPRLPRLQFQRMRRSGTSTRWTCRWWSRPAAPRRARAWPVCATRDEAEAFIRECLDDQRFGRSGLRILLEECIFGPELSVLIVTDGQDYCLLAPSRDHKRIGEGDTGPNTGGMGAFAPVLLAAGTARGDRRAGRAAGPGRTATPRHPVPRRALRRDHADGHRAAGARIQLPVRGSGNAGRAAPVARRPAGTVRGHRRPANWARTCSSSRPREDDPADWAGAGLSDWRRHCVVVVGAADGYPGRHLSGRPIELPRRP